jgi:hypothetical protein
LKPTLFDFKNQTNNRIMKLLFSSFFIFFIFFANAQVGIGTTSPAATLDITASPTTGTTVEGVLIPRVTRQRAKDMGTNPSISTLIYVTTLDGVANLTAVNITSVGFYFFNGTVWEKLASGAINGWMTTGNAGLSGTTNFMGTTDNVDVAFRRNNTAAGKIGATSTSFGVGALNSGVTSNSAAFGTNALQVNTGDNNVAVGNGTLAANTTGIQNTGVGNAALAANRGSASTGIGYRALASNTTGNNGTAVGFEALSRNTTASNNTAVGFQTLTNNTTGLQNTSTGFQASYLISTGSRNTSVGYSALAGNSIGNENTAIGNYALGRNTGSGNTAIGHESMFGSGSAFNNSTAVGWHALFNNSANDNTAVGYNALQGNLGASGNTGIGKGVLNNNSSGNNNTAVGFEAGFAVTSSNNTFIGYTSGQYSGGSNNTALGANTLKANYATANNVAIGYNALAVSSANNNTAVGYSASSGNTSGTTNTAIGYGALSANAVGSGNVALGYQAGSAETSSNKLYIENSNADANGALIYGEFDANIVRVNGTLQVNNPLVAGYAFPTVRGTNGYVLQTNGAGATSWAPIPVNTVNPFTTTGASTGIYNVSLSHYTVRVYNDVSEVRLPTAVGNAGKVFIIIGSNGIGTKILSTAGGGIYDDVTNATITTISTNERYMVQSDGTGWLVIGR